jgi:S1-C subfamily serine protease
MKIVRTLRVNAKFPQGNDNRTEALPFIGSPLLDAKGRVVAVVGPDLQPQSRGQQGVGCAEAIRGFLANLSLFNQGYQQTHTWLSSLGATCYPAGQAKRLGIPVAHGIVVEYVYLGEAADRAGVRGGNRVGTYTWSSDDSHGANRITDQCVVGGDVIVAVDGKPITGSNWVAWGQYSKACDKKPGDSVRLTLLRGNRRFTVTLPLEAMPYRAPSA